MNRTGNACRCLKLNGFPDNTPGDKLRHCILNELCFYLYVVLDRKGDPPGWFKDDKVSI